MNINPVDRKNIGQIAGEWDNIALKRHELIVSGKDLSFSHVLLPCILDNIHDCNLNIVVDCGCGTGVLTSKIASKANQVFGVDVSPNSIEIAKKYYLDIDNLIFFKIY